MGKVEKSKLFLGLDFGTSGARATIIDQHKQLIWQNKIRFQQVPGLQLASIWQESLFHLLDQIPVELSSQIQAIAIDGTSSTVLLLDSQGNVLMEPLLYNDDRGKEVKHLLSQVAPPDHLVQSATSSLAKLLWYSQQSEFQQAHYFCHQADWLASLLHGSRSVSDYHNALKLGYDPQQLTYPNWLKNAPWFSLLPPVITPGRVISRLSSSIVNAKKFAKNCLVCAGTTDSIAAFLASGATQPGEAVTSLGSTLVLKLLSDKPVTNLASGIYSHRLGDLWLTGGASNAGGAVLQHYFSSAQLTALSAQINPHQPSGLDYYPLLQPGERFPINDPNLLPRLEPRPGDDVAFLHGLLESLARIEVQGYEKLQKLGATTLTKVFTAGGGAHNLTWQTIRQNLLQVPVQKSAQSEAAYGSACLAINSQSWE
ncbi:MULTISPECIES: FGGY-family carbohydrate kinase [unclassified Synechocystis]|uniref:FGGY-family carbohydrate kinase n=1 Tax=unclassified Synechocystis TaxID=2640012 RepID=UPI0004228B22|nr:MULTISPECIES: FGGY-family carbohydrate kinase [unclassified Synechocystis]AIE73884.1 Carbohydrate kinase, FGGY family [Synechocystis sp. PCC 6714]MCT0252461.1 FGGY-family carbohydrate kinase [Synechocystis sp. CS-94]